MTRYSLPVIIYLKCQFLHDVSKTDKKQVKRELERRSILEDRNWSDRSSRPIHSTTLLLKTLCKRLKLLSRYIIDISILTARFVKVGLYIPA